MKINTLSQNNPAFGVKMAFYRATVGDAKNQAKKMPQKLIACHKIHLLIANNIQKSYDERPLSNLLNSIKYSIVAGLSQHFKNALQESHKTIEQAFCETCDKLFDVQLQKYRYRLTKLQRKYIITSCIEFNKPNTSHNSAKNIDLIHFHVQNNLNIKCSLDTIKNHTYAVFMIPKIYNKFMSNANCPKKLKNFHEYIKKQNMTTTYNIVYNDFDIFKYSIEKYNEAFPYKALKFEEE